MVGSVLVFSCANGSFGSVSIVRDSLRILLVSKLLSSCDRYVLPENSPSQNKNYYHLSKSRTQSTFRVSLSVSRHLIQNPVPMTPDPTAQAQVFLPRVAPRDATDAVISLVIGLIQTGLLFILPGLLFYEVVPNAILAWGTGIALYALFVAHCVTNVIVDATGIHFTRKFGNPRSIEWSNVSAVVEASRSELIIHGWCWPLVLPREMTPSCTSLGHFRIQSGKEFVYFPPADAQAFVRAVALHAPWGKQVSTRHG